MSEAGQEQEFPPRGGNTVFELEVGPPSNPRKFRLSSARHRFLPFLNAIELALPELLKRLEPEAAQVYPGEAPVRFAAADTTLTLSDYVLDCDASAASFTVTLPSATNQGVTFVVVKKDVGANTITVVPFGADTIQGGASKVLSAQWQKCVLTADGVNCWIDEAVGGT